MSFLSEINGGTPAKTTAGSGGSSNFLGGIRQRNEREQLQSKAKAEAETAAAESARLNNPASLAMETVKGIPKTAWEGAKMLIDDPMRVLATPVIRAEQAIATSAGRAIGGDFGGRLERAANQPMTLPSALGGAGGTIQPQRGFDNGGAAQIAGDTAQYAATVFTGGRAKPLVDLAGKGFVKQAAIQGSKEGALGTGAYIGGAEASREGSTAGSIATETGKGLVLGGFLGGVLGGGGAALAKPGALRAAAEAEATRMRPLPVQSETTFYHGTQAPNFDQFKGSTYLTSDPKEAQGFADGVHLGGARGGESRVLETRGNFNKVKDIDEVVLDAMEDGDIDEVIDAAVAQAKTEGYDAVSFSHPSSYSDGEFTAYVPTSPENLPIGTPGPNTRRIKQLPVTGGGRARNVPINRAQEPHLTDAEMPAINMGARTSKSDLPTIDLDAPAPIIPEKTEVGITSYRGKPSASVNDIAPYYETTRAKGFVKSLNETAGEYSVKVDRMDRTAGSWEGSIEPSFSVKTSGTPQSIRAYAAANAKKANQDAVILFTPGEGKSVKYTFKGVKNPDAFLKKLHNEGISGATVNGDNVLVYDLDGSLKKAVAKASKSTKNLPEKVSGSGELIFKDNYDKFIKAGNRGSVRPEVRTKAGTKADTGPDLTFEPIGPPKPSPKVPKPARAETTAKAPRKASEGLKTPARSQIKAPVGKPVTMDIPRKTATVPVREPKAGEAVTKPKASTDINKKLAAAGFDQVDEDLMPGITSINKADQIEKVARLLEDVEASKRMAYGEIPIPDGVAPQVLFNAVKNRAVQEADGEVLRRLATSKIATERSQAAQTLGSAGFNNGPADATDAIRDITKTRTKAAERRKQPSSIPKEVKAAKASIKMVQAKQTWNDVVDSLTC